MQRLSAGIAKRTKETQSMLTSSQPHRQQSAALPERIDAGASMALPYHSTRRDMQ
jgi:hypothetical protein